MTAPGASPMGGLSTAHAPALDLPARFMALAMALLGVVAALAPWAYALLPAGIGDRRLLAFVHLNTLGVVGAMIVGASFQLVPVVLQTPLASVTLGRRAFWLYLAGLSLFLPGFLLLALPALALGASLLVAAFGLYLTVVAWTAWRSPRRDVVVWHVLVASLGLVGGVALGLLLAVNKTTGFLGARTGSILAGHVALMLGAWVAVLIHGVAYRLVGMFTLSEDRFSERAAWLSLGLSVGGAWVLAGSVLLGAGRAPALAAAVALALGQVLFAGHLARLYRGRRRRAFDVHIPFAVTAAASGVLAGGLTVAGVAADRRPGDWVWTAAVWLALAGLAESAILGFFYKIATFLVWLHRYAPVAGRQRVPRLESLYGRRLAVAGWALWVAAQGSAIAAIVAGWLWLGHVAGVVAAAALGCFLVNVARIGSHWWSGRATDVWLTGFVARARRGSRSAEAREG